MDQFVGFSVVFAALWISGFGVAMIVQQHHRYLAWTRQGLRALARRLGRMVAWAWHRWHVQIVWFAIGSAVTFYLLRLG